MPQKNVLIEPSGTVWRVTAQYLSRGLDLGDPSWCILLANGAIGSAVTLEFVSGPRYALEGGRQQESV